MSAVALTALVNRYPFAVLGNVTHVLNDLSAVNGMAPTDTDVAPLKLIVEETKEIDAGVGVGVGIALGVGVSVGVDEGV